MKRAEFMKELSERLSVLPEEERQSALSYYEEYFNDAKDEERAVVELGTPEYVAGTILEDFRDIISSVKKTEESAGNKQSGGNDKNPFSKQAPNYSDYAPPYSEYYQTGQTYKAENYSQPKTSGANKVLVAIILILLSPVILPLAAAAVVIVVSLTAAALAVLVALVVAGVAAFFAGIFAVVYSIVHYPFLYAGILGIGAGLVSIGVGIFLTIAGVWVCSKLIPSIIRGFVALCRKAFERRRNGGAA